MTDEIKYDDLKEGKYDFKLYIKP